jgi:hypothetical protein
LEAGIAKAVDRVFSLGGEARRKALDDLFELVKPQVVSDPKIWDTMMRFFWAGMTPEERARFELVRMESIGSEQ